MKTTPFDLRISATLADYTLDCWSSKASVPQVVSQNSRTWTIRIESLEQLKEFEAQADVQADNDDTKDTLHYAAKRNLPRLTAMVRALESL